MQLRTRLSMVVTAPPCGQQSVVAKLGLIADRLGGLWSGWSAFRTKKRSYLW